MKKTLSVLVIAFLLTMTIIVNLPGDVSVSNKILKQKVLIRSVEMEESEMAIWHGGSLWKCFLGIGTALVGAFELPSFEGFITYAAGITAINNNCIFVL